MGKVPGSGAAGFTGARVLIGPSRARGPLDKAQAREIRQWAPENYFRLSVYSEIASWLRGLRPEPAEIRTARKSLISEHHEVRKNGDWEGWTKFLLRGVEQTSLEAVETAKKVIAFREAAFRAASSLGSTELKLIEFLFSHPLTDIQTAQKQLGVSYNTAAAAIAKFESANLVKETTGRQRNRIFRFAAYLDLFESPATSAAAPSS